MQKIFLTVMLGGGLFLVGCQTASTTTEKPTEPTTNNETKDTSKVDPNLQATFPFKDYPSAETTAKPGEVVLVPSYNWLQEVMTNDKKTMIWYAQKMSAPDKEMSEVEYSVSREKKKVPNAYIVPIPAGGNAKKGDIVLTWWQSGSGMQRAIVVDDANPSQPVVRYLDLKYDNPAKSRDGKTTIGQMDEQLKPDSFVKINNPMDVGTSVAIQDGTKQKAGQIINVAGDKVFVRMFAGTIGVFAKSSCTPIPIVPSVKAGDKVKAPFVGTMNDATVVKVDEKIGRVFVKFENAGKEEAVAFGDVIK